MDASNVQKKKSHVRKRKNVKMDVSSDRNKKGHVKKPLNAYFVWCKQFRKKILEQNLNITIIEANTLLGKIWSEMSAEQKKPYFKESERIKKQHQLDYPEFEIKSKPRVKHANMLSAYPYQQHGVYYTQMVPRQGRIPQEFLYKSPFFEVTSTQMKYAVAQENSPHMVGREESISSNVSEILSDTREILYKNSICVQLPETELYKEPRTSSSEHLYERQSKYDPVIMTTRRNNDSEIIEHSSTGYKSEGLSGIVLRIPEQNGTHFDPECYGHECSANDDSKSESLQTLPLSQPRNKIIESDQLLVDDSRLHTQICNANIPLGTENYQNATISEQVQFEGSIIDAGSTTLNNDQHINKSAEMFPKSKSEIFSDDDFESLKCLEDLVSAFCSDEDFSSTTFLNEEGINLEDFAQLL